MYNRKLIHNVKTSCTANHNFSAVGKCWRRASKKNPLNALSVAISPVKNNDCFLLWCRWTLTQVWMDLNCWVFGLFFFFFMHLKINRKQSWQRRWETTHEKDCEYFNVIYLTNVCENGRLRMPFFYGLMTYQTVAWDPYLQPSWLGQTLQSVMTHQFLSHFLGLTLHQ